MNKHPSYRTIYVKTDVLARERTHKHTLTYKQTDRQTDRHTHTHTHTHTHIHIFCLLAFRGESPGCRLISTASVLEWLRPSHPHYSQRSSIERWSRNTLRMVIARVCCVLRGGINAPLILIIQLRRQHHLTWSATLDAVSREINIWKSFDLLLVSTL